MSSCSGENDTTDAVLVARIMGDGGVWYTLPARFRAISDNRSRFDKPGITNIHITANVLSAFIGEVLVRRPSSLTAVSRMNTAEMKPNFRGWSIFKTRPALAPVTRRLGSWQICGIYGGAEGRGRGNARAWHIRIRPA